VLVSCIDLPDNHFEVFRHDVGDDDAVAAVGMRPIDHLCCPVFVTRHKKLLATVHGPATRTLVSTL
jgi:hypothetical protein